MKQMQLGVKIGDPLRFKNYFLTSAARLVLVDLPLLSLNIVCIPWTYRQFVSLSHKCDKDNLMVLEVYQSIQWVQQQLTVSSSFFFSFYMSPCYDLYDNCLYNTCSVLLLSDFPQLYSLFLQSVVQTIYYVFLVQKYLFHMSMLIPYSIVKCFASFLSWQCVGMIGVQIKILLSKIC